MIWKLKLRITCCRRICRLCRSMYCGMNIQGWICFLMIMDEKWLINWSVSLLFQAHIWDDSLWRTDPTRERVRGSSPRSGPLCKNITHIARVPNRIQTRQSKARYQRRRSHRSSRCKQASYLYIYWTKINVKKEQSFFRHNSWKLWLSITI